MFCCLLQLQFNEPKGTRVCLQNEQVIKMIIVDVTAYKTWSNNSHLSFSKRKIWLRVIAKSNLYSPTSNLNFHFYEIFSASKLCMCKRCFDMLLIDSFYTIERITVICKRIFFCLAHISHLPILIQLKEVRTVWPMNEPYFNWGHFYVNWSKPSTNSQPVTSDLQLLFWKVTAWSQKRKRILNAGKYFIMVQNYSTECWQVFCGGAELQAGVKSQRL